MKVVLAWLLLAFLLIAIVANLIKWQRSVPPAKKIRDHHRGWHKL